MLPADASGAQLNAERATPAWLAAYAGPRRGELLQLAMRFCGRRADAEDAVQTALLTAMTRLAQLRDESRAESWLKSIVARASLDLTRTRRTHLELSAAERVADNATPSAPSEPAANVRCCLPMLPDRQRMALTLRHLCGMEYSEVADVMEIRESTARVLVRAARENLRRLLKELGAENTP